MAKVIKRYISVTLSVFIVLAVVLSVNLHINAAAVEYVYAEGRYIKNWGIREQTATFLSPKAEDFYKKNQTSFEMLSSYSGMAGTNDVSSSELYQQLHNLMKNNHTFITDYGYTRYKYQYTDIQNSGKDSNKISSFYSGKEIGPAWDYGETWNREHTWPNSKGEGDGENDIMMLRPTAKSENGSRSNTAYGKSVSFYNPNTESGGKHDLRGDVARIVLYQHVRWKQTRLFGSSGVIESREVLLEWIQADPVDTWELGRNDSVESITGTRNVFVDYPELAFILFGEQVPENYQSPSSNTQGSSSSGSTASSTTDSNQSNNSNNNNQSSGPEGSSQNTQQNIYVGSDVCYHSRARIVEAEAPRCETEGYTEGKYCPNCKEYISGRELIEPTGHTYAGDCDATCDVCSSTREIYPDVKHNFENDVCTICAIEDSQQLTEEEQITTDEQDVSKGRNAWWIILVAVVVIGAGATLVVIYRDKIWPKETE